MTPAEISGYLHAWRVTGRILGIRDDALTDDRGLADAVFTLVSRRNCGPSPEGSQLTQNLLDLYADFIPGKAFDGFAPALVRYLVGDQMANWLDVPRTPWELAIGAYVGMLRAFEFAEDHVPFAAGVLDRLEVLATGAEYRLLSRGHQATLELPATLAGAE